MPKLKKKRFFSRSVVRKKNGNSAKEKLREFMIRIQNGKKQIRSDEMLNHFFCLFSFVFPRNTR